MTPFTTGIAVVLWLHLHPLHVSVTEIEMNDSQHRLEIMMRIFMDDLETSFRNELNMPELDIMAPKSTTLDQMMERYLATHFKISVDNVLQKTSYLGHEQDGEAFVFYIEVDNVKKWNTISITNDILMKTFRDQSNLVHVTSGNTVKSLRLTRDKAVDQLTFDEP